MVESEHSDLISFAARGRECKHIFPYDVMSDYTNDVASMALVQECAAGTYVSIAMRIMDVQPRRSLTQNETATAHGRCHRRSCHALPQPD